MKMVLIQRTWDGNIAARFYMMGVSTRGSTSFKYIKIPYHGWFLTEKHAINI